LIGTERFEAPCSPATAGQGMRLLLQFSLNELLSIANREGKEDIALGGMK